MAMNTTTETEEKVLRAKYAALMRELGPAEFIRRTQQASPGKGDYTAERQQPDTLTFKEIQEMLARVRAANGDVSPR